MAVCTTILPAGGVDYVIRTAGDPTTCAGSVLLSSTEYNGFISNLANFGWDSSAFELAFVGALLLFAIGLTIGLVMSQIRKARI